MSSAAQFDENTRSTYFAGHCRLPFSFAVSSKALNLAAVSTFVVHSNLCHDTHFVLRDRPLLFEYVLFVKQGSWVGRDGGNIWQRRPSLSM